MRPVAIAGASGYAKVVIDILERAGQYAIAGLIDRPGKVEDALFGYAVLGDETALPGLVAQYALQGVVIAVGDNALRADIAGRIAGICAQLPFVSAVHPGASIGRGVTIGAGSVIMAGAVVNPGCRVGRHCIVNTHASLDHDSVMEDFASLAPHVATGGNCRIGAHAAIGIGAVLRHGITIGAHCVVGAGSVVMKDIAPFVVAYGSPARPVRERKYGEPYL